MLSLHFTLRLSSRCLRFSSRPTDSPCPTVSPRNVSFVILYYLCPIFSRSIVLVSSSDHSSLLHLCSPSLFSFRLPQLTSFLSSLFHVQIHLTVQFSQNSVPFQIRFSSTSSCPLSPLFIFLFLQTTVHGGYAPCDSPSPGPLGMTAPSFDWHSRQLESCGSFHLPPIHLIVKPISHWKKKFLESNKLAVAGGQPHMLSIEHYI